MNINKQSNKQPDLLESTTTMQRAKALLEEAHTKLYPGMYHLSAGAKDMRDEVRKPQLDYDLLQTAQLLQAAIEKLGLNYPIDMVLHCPKCHEQHVDMPGTHWVDSKDQLHREPKHWFNPPHRSHLCHSCGHIWRPADVPTNGVLFVQTRGANDSPLPSHLRAKP